MRPIDTITDDDYDRMSWHARRQLITEAIRQRRALRGDVSELTEALTQLDTRLAEHPVIRDRAARRAAALLTRNTQKHWAARERARARYQLALLTADPEGPARRRAAAADAALHRTHRP